MEEDAVAFEGTGSVGRRSDDLNVVTVGNDEARWKFEILVGVGSGPAGGLGSRGMIPNCSPAWNQFRWIWWLEWSR